MGPVLDDVGERGQAALVSVMHSGTTSSSCSCWPWSMPRSTTLIPSWGCPQSSWAGPTRSAALETGAGRAAASEMVTENMRSLVDAAATGQRTAAVAVSGPFVRCWMGSRPIQRSTMTETQRSRESRALHRGAYRTLITPVRAESARTTG